MRRVLSSSLRAIHPNVYAAGCRVPILALHVSSDNPSDIRSRDYIPLPCILCLLIEQCCIY